MNLADAHVHLADEAFLTDIEEVLQRTQQAQVSLLLNVTTTAEELQRSFAYAELRSDICFLHAAGTPPQDALDSTAFDASFSYFKQEAQAQRLAAIGEVGLDYLFATTEEQQEQQRSILKHYFSLALDTELPLVIHCRQAFADFFHMLDRHYHHDARAKPGMLHCFTGSVEEVHELLSRGWYVSISGIATFKNLGSLKDVIPEIPLDRLLVETDAPYLAPVPHRGRRNEPAFVRYTLEKIAEMKNIPLEELVQQVYNNLLSYIALRHGYAV